MAQLNPNFEIDFSDINSYEQIQLINDTQLAKENLLMHRAYKEPSDDEIIRNHFSSFTFVDFCPKLYSVQPPAKVREAVLAAAASSRKSAVDPKSDCDNQQPQANKNLKYYELETFTDLFERINAWLKLNKDWRVVSMQTLIYDCTTQFNHLKSSIHSVHLPENTRGLRLFLTPSKSRFSGPQKIGCINVVPRRISSGADCDDSEAKYENLDQILQRLNELLLTRPIEGRILSVETITLPMLDGQVNTETNYFMDSRLNLLNESTYNLAATNNATTASTTCEVAFTAATATSIDQTGDSSQPQTQSTNIGQSSSNQRALIDILRVYYEFGPMVCGLVNVIDFLPRFYSPTQPAADLASPSTSSAQPQTEGQPSADSSLVDVEQRPQRPPIRKIAPTESLTRVVRRSLAWFENERKSILNQTDPSTQPNEGAQEDTDTRRLPGLKRKSSHNVVNLKVCNLQIHQKSFTKKQLIEINSSNAIQSCNTRLMAHEKVKPLDDSIVCPQCEHSTTKEPFRDWCQHLVSLTQPYNLKFVRLAYVVPVYNKYTRPSYPLKLIQRSQRRKSHETADATGNLLSDSLAQELLLTSSSSSSSSSPTSSRNSSRASSPDPSLYLVQDKDEPLLAAFQVRKISRVDSTPAPTATTSGDKATTQTTEATGESEQSNLPIGTADNKDKEDGAEQTDQLGAGCQTKGEYDMITDSLGSEALIILQKTNDRHLRDEQANQFGEDTLNLDDAPIGQLTYRLFAPSQLVKSSSCFSINPVNSSSPLARRGSVDLNGGGISSENAHPSTHLLSGSSQSSLTQSTSDLQQVVVNSLVGSFLPASSNGANAGASGANSQSSSGLDVSNARATSSTAPQANNSKFTTNEFEPIELIRRRMEVYVTTNPMKVIAAETTVVNLRDALSCLSSAIEQTIVEAPFGRRRPTTWVSVYILYAAVALPPFRSERSGSGSQQEEPQSLAVEEVEINPDALFEDDFPSFTEKERQQPEALATVEEGDEEAERLAEEEAARAAEAELTIYNPAYDRTVPLPTQPDNHLDETPEPIDFVGSKSDRIWLPDESTLIDDSKEQKLDYEKRKRRKKRNKAHSEDSQCSII